MSNRRRLRPWLRKPPRQVRLVCPECVAGRHPNAPHCAFCGAQLDEGQHPEPWCEQAKTLYRATLN